MNLTLHEHLLVRMRERGVTEEEIRLTFLTGESYPAQLGRIGFRRNFSFEDFWKGKYYGTKQVELIAVEEVDEWVGVTVISRFF